MQLTKIKMSGFKSFVDPTTVMLPSKMVAVVGPNGCGKSNIIDAVTWVMGESSPKYLRGESLTDVIFNGSSARKPVGQASVELVFDNSDGTIGGEYATYAEISVKRSINRQSDSTYYLNGVRCRKRDVVDIFLGTGLGPRSYSIVGQNMITRIIEAKPDDMRGYLEEAAGISQYKQRRHETELRMSHTKENLARVGDLQTELEKQLSHLKHQANVAEKYKTLKQQERALRSEWYGIQWRELDIRMVDATLNIQKEETALEGRQAEMSKTDREMEQLRNEQRTVNDGFQEIQRRYYAVGNEITRVEQDILHHQERRKQWEGDLSQVETDWQDVCSQLEEANDTLGELKQEIHAVEPEFLSAGKDVHALRTELEQAEENRQDWQGQWDEFNKSVATVTQTAQVEQIRIQQVEQRISMLAGRRDQLQQEQSSCNFTKLNEEIESYSKQAEETAERLQNQHEQMDALRSEINTLQGVQQESTIKLDKLRSELQRLRGQQASLEALQQTALGQRNSSVTPWLSKHNLSAKPRLAQQIEVENGWELAAEKVLGFCLQAICVDNADDLVNDVNAFNSGNLCLFLSDNLSDKTSSTQNGKKGELLLTKVKCPWALDSLLTGIYTADTMEEALSLCEKLDVNESVVTKDGIWLNQSWLKILREDDPSAGVFQREQELKQLTSQIADQQNEQQALEKNINARRDHLQKLEQQRDQLQQAINQLQSQSAQINAQYKMRQEKYVELTKLSERLSVDFESCIAQMKQAETEQTDARTLWQKALSELEQKENERTAILSERDTVHQYLQQTRDAFHATKERTHNLEIRLQTAKSQQSSLEQAIMRLKNQAAALNERKTTLQSELSSMTSLDTLKDVLSRALDKHVNVESELNVSRAAVETLDSEFRHLEEKRQVIERDINNLRNLLESLRVEMQGWKVKNDTLMDQLKETEVSLEQVLKELPPDANADEWQAKLEQVVQRINRLGPINLVAIEEYATCLERKQYLDAQTADLYAGLATLEDAIAKIDRETRSRFKETYDTVNARFQELFPTIFGGGKAYLELTEDDFLTAGVTLMACPPGKRNSTIHLLSGGEKSLTAIALIFSIFHLNPAPFCLLDEVDAALDDANVVRFTRLVDAMADKTQFIFISHNKITIEMGQHLIGVTMNEPGVSRLVSVDIEKAISLAEIETPTAT